MSGIDEYILGACFIETKPKPLPWDEASREEKDANRSDCKAENGDIHIDVKEDVNHEHTEADGIIAKGKAENILTQITLGDLKLRDINVTGKKSKEVESGGGTVTKIVDVGLEQESLNTRQFLYNPNKQKEYNSDKRIGGYSVNDGKESEVELGKLDECMVGTYGEGFGFGWSYRPSFTEQPGFRSYTNAQLKSQGIPLIHERNTAVVGPKGIETIKTINVRPYWDKLLHHEDELKDMNEKRRQTADITVARSTESDKSEKSNVTGVSSAIRNLSLVSFELNQESNPVGTINKVNHVKVGTEVNLEKEKAYGELTDAQVECRAEIHRKEIVKQFSNERLGYYQDISTVPDDKLRKSCLVGIVGKKMFANGGSFLTGNVRATDLSGRKGKIERKSARTKDERFGSKILKPLSNDPLRVTKDNQSDCPMRGTVCHVDRENKKSTGLSERGITFLRIKNIQTDESISSKGETLQNKKQSDDKSNEKTIVSFDGDVYDITTTKDNNSDPCQYEGDCAFQANEKRSDGKTKDVNHKTKESGEVTQYEEVKEGNSLEKYTKERSNIQTTFKGIGCGSISSGKRDKCVNIINVAHVENGRDICKVDGNKNNRRDEAIKLTEETKRKKKKKPRADNVKSKRNKADKVSVDEDVFDITPAKDTPWSPSQDDDNGVIQAKKRKPGRETKMKKSRVKAENCDVEDGTSLTSCAEFRRINKKSYTGIGYESSHTKQSKSVEMINVAPVEKKGDKCDIRRNNKNNEFSKDVSDDNITTHTIDNSRIDNPPLVTVKEHTIADKVGNKYNNIDKNSKVKKKTRKKRKKIKKKIENNIEKGITKVKTKWSQTTTPIVSLTNTIDSIQDDGDLDKSKNIVLKRPVNDPYNSLEIDKAIEDIDNKYKPINVRDIGESNTILTPIIEEDIEDDEFTINSLNFIVETSEVNERNEAKHDVDINDKVSLPSLQCECRACVDEVDIPDIDNTYDVVRNEIRTGRWRRFLKWITCCFKPKVNE